MTDAFGHWLAGFIDGEGCFTIDSRNGDGFVCRFKLKLRADDAEILHEIHQRLGIGEVSQPTLDHGRSALNGNPAVRWEVRTKDDCERLVQILDEYPLRAKKARDFEIWRTAVSTWCLVERANRNSPASKRAVNTRLWAEMARLAEELKLVRVYRETIAPTVQIESPSQMAMGEMS